MSAKQDRQGVRTATDLERKWKFGESFSEVMGAAADARTAADAAQRAAEEAAAKADNPAEALTQDDVFNLLTNNGLAKGLFRDDNGELYINASYLRTGVITSENGAIKIDLAAEQDIPVFNTGISTNSLIVRGDEYGDSNLFTVEVGRDGNLKFASVVLKDNKGNSIVQLTEDVSRTGGGIKVSNDTGKLHATMQSTTESTGFTLIYNGARLAYFGMDNTGRSALQCDYVGCSQIEGRTIFWQPNGDGTYTLMGS